MSEKTQNLIYVVGLGADGQKHLTPAAREAVAHARTVLGYRPYCEQIRHITEGKQCIASGMGEEVARAREAVERAETGEVVAVISSGDPGVYGMAGLLMEVLEEQGNTDIHVEVVPGVTAANAAAAVLGAPLMSDFATVSLSDLLTPRQTIRRRVKAAIEGDFVTALYNPRSKNRYALLDETLQMFARHRGSGQCAGFVRNAGRENQQRWLGTLGELPAENVDMATIIIIGNSTTFLSNGRMIAKRGYQVEEKS